MTKEQALQLIERLAEKTLSFGCKFTTKSIFNPDQEHTVVDIEMNYEGDRELLPPFEEVTDEDGIVYPVTKIKNILGHPVFIGDVLEKMLDVEYEGLKGSTPVFRSAFCELWKECGFSKSLQTILKESEYEEIFVDCISDERFPKCQELHMYDHKQTMLTSPAKELFEFLDQLFPNK